MEMITLFVTLAAVFFIVGVFILRWMFRIDDIVKHLKNLDEDSERRNILAIKNREKTLWIAQRMEFLIETGKDALESKALAEMQYTLEVENKTK